MGADAASLHRVVVVARHGVMPMELGIVHQLFATARSPVGRPLYEVLTCGMQAGEVRTDADFRVCVPHGPEVLGTADTVVLPASHEQDLQDDAPGPQLAAALTRVRPGTRVASICTAAFPLAAAGLLDGRRATTHWLSADAFRERFPTVELQPDVLYTDNGDVLTSAGEAAGVDLCLHMIRSDFGATVAADVARRTVVPPHREGGQGQYIPGPVTEPGRAYTSTARRWALEHLDRALSLSDLAAQESVSVRTFTRRFRDEVGVSPRQWLIQQRLLRARELLEGTDHPVDRVATASGFGTAAALRQHMRATLGVSPSRYRATFRGGPRGRTPRPRMTPDAQRAGPGRPASDIGPPGSRR